MKIIKILILLLIISLPIYFFNKKGETQESYVFIDINPSLQLILNKEDQVKKILPLNKEATNIIKELNPENIEIKEAIELITKYSLESGYINEYEPTNIVTITVVSKIQSEIDRIERKIISKIKNQYNKKEVYPLIVATSLNSDLIIQADSYNITYEKMKFIDKYLKYDNKTKMADLVELSFDEIQNKFKSRSLKTKYNEAEYNIRLKEIKTKKESYLNQLYEKSLLEYETKEEIINEEISIQKTKIKNVIESFTKELTNEQDELSEEPINKNYPLISEEHEKLENRILRRFNKY